ncbi:MAG TPA: ABC-type transport auxiliary lipoprotein family protein [Rhodocyclaceae bacterium]|nr:ABC-type transport auxiliary lipoprotein family protein [Rhodocyclaceae bacterium]
MNRAKRMRAGIALVVALTLTLGGCFTSPASRPNVAAFDLGEVVSAPALNTPWLGALDVTAPSWLDSRAMQYRLAAEPARRQSYAESRWAATPAELLATSLRRQLGATSVNGDGCRLRIELDEWVQSFDAEGNSQAQIALRAGLYTAKGDGQFARQAFSLKVSAGRDARQGVATFVALEQRLASDLGRWLTQLAKEQNLPARCRS